MLTPDTILVFLPASLLLALMPGPDNLFVLTQSMLHGRVAGLRVTLGLCTGLLVHTAAVALGLAALFQTSETAFSVLKFAGAGYLLYLAWHAFRAGAAAVPDGSNASSGGWKLYRRGIIMNVTNPKVSIFFLALLPQFIDSAQGSVAGQIVQLGGWFIAATFAVFGSVALMAGTVGEWLTRSARAQTILNRVAGLVFLGIAFKLATMKR